MLLGEITREDPGMTDAWNQYAQVMVRLGRNAEALAAYNAEVARGIVHTPEWGERMAEDVLRLAGFIENVNYIKQTKTFLVVSGAGAAALSCLGVLEKLGLPKENMWVTDIKGVVWKGRNELMDPWKERYARDTRARTLGEVIEGADIFLGLSAYALTTRKDFSFMGGFLTVGVLVAFLAGLAAIFFEIPALSLTVSAAFVLLASGLILWETSNIIHGGETNYIMATVSLFVSIINLFTSLLQLLGIVGGDRD